MKKKLFALLILFALVFANIFAETPPVASGGWKFSDGTLLAEPLKEKDDYAIVNGRKVHYWLYNTQYVPMYIKEEMIAIFFPVWLQSLGYTIDYQSYYMIMQNERLAESARELMRKHNANISVALVDEKGSEPCFVINEDLGGNVYKYRYYGLIKNQQKK